MPISTLLLWFVAIVLQGPLPVVQVRWNERAVLFRTKLYEEPWWQVKELNHKKDKQVFLLTAKNAELSNTRKYPAILKMNNAEPTCMKNRLHGKLQVKNKRCSTVAAAGTVPIAIIITG